ncbi:methyltransferase family protein [Haloactinopolyspora alba]|uniref:Methyltransferase family protein n=1 Tax=Haloactinopolyspora alba TaxID=648780 RepID=A0A2P8E8X8_9ACTN|nr:class I SAM-dependent methyltransferase [Haloactinopolyspora alba]PSL05936.1 methyltransferase family protein [Haloactinopolyspora alba]
MPEDREARIRAFDAAATDFERLGHHLWDPIGAATVDVTSPRAGERVLDACCGHGASAVPAARRVGADGLVDAVDVSAPMIDLLNRRADGISQLRARQGDVTSWPRGDYDVVQSALGIFFFPDMDAGTEQLIGRARPGGRVGLTIWRRGAMDAAGDHLRAAVARVTGTEPADRPARRPIDRINQPDTYEAWLTERGLADVTVTEHDLRIPTTPDVAWLIVTGSGYVAALDDLGPDQVEAVRDAYLESLRRDGVDEIDATTLIGLGTRAH